MVKIGSIHVTLGNLKCLNEKMWLNDEVINVFNVLVKEFQNKYTGLTSKNHLFPTLFLSQFQQFGYRSVKNYSKNVNLYNFEKLIFQVN